MYLPPFGDAVLWWLEHGNEETIVSSCHGHIDRSRAKPPAHKSVERPKGWLFHEQLDGAV